MPRRRRRWRGGQGREACPRRVDRFLESCLLLLLHCSESHGYELSEGLLQFGYEASPADSSTVYRTLRMLEEEGFVTSRWDTASAGPARRLYKITEDGDEYLSWWVQDLQETERVLRRFSEMYSEHMENHQ